MSPFRFHSFRRQLVVVIGFVTATTRSQGRSGLPGVSGCRVAFAIRLLSPLTPTANLLHNLDRAFPRRDVAQAAGVHSHPVGRDSREMQFLPLTPPGRAQAQRTRRGAETFIVTQGPGSVAG